MTDRFDIEDSDEQEAIDASAYTFDPGNMEVSRVNTAAIMSWLFADRWPCEADEDGQIKPRTITALSLEFPETDNEIMMQFAQRYGIFTSNHGDFTMVALDTDSGFPGTLGYTEVEGFLFRGQFLTDGIEPIEVMSEDIHYEVQSLIEDSRMDPDDYLICLEGIGKGESPEQTTYRGASQAFALALVRATQEALLNAR